MWDALQSSRFQELRRRQDEGHLTVEEQAELAGLIHEIEAAEAAYLRPATLQIQRDRETIETQNGRLEVLVRRKEALAKRLHDFLADSQRERRSIESELAAVLAESPASQTDQ